MEIVIEEMNKYRFAWYDPETELTMRGTFLFNEAREAVSTYAALKKTFPFYEVWLEDRDGTRVEIPR